ncbi:hypothetical protein RhiirA5_436981 [Rhizophagus irregularis]|uniref:Uncharacterized protein n=1 Tax=Rhizophagus irregularis TaxID=588596 RepID=A0A2N0RXI3_9GLOM|nr:hypothetical protein RhiirA5_436981 [Rhizophagus irregularis]PKC68014.1 hypothetical protein RhiirA1_457726 [Rhizophagus irregularis]
MSCDVKRNYLLEWPNAYYESFPNFLRGFFDGLIGEIFKKKLINLNKKRKQREKPLKQLDVEHITKCVTFFASLIISMAFPYLGVWFTQWSY